MTTGSEARNAVFISPFASAAVEGTATFSPGTPMKSELIVPVCWPAHPAAKP